MKDQRKTFGEVVGQLCRWFITAVYASVVLLVFGYLFSALFDPLGAQDSGSSYVIDFVALLIYGILCVVAFRLLFQVLSDIVEWGRTKSPWAVRYRQEKVQAELQQELGALRAELAGTKTELEALSEESRSRSHSEDGADKDEDSGCGSPANREPSEKRLEARQRVRNRFIALERNQRAEEQQAGEDGQDQSFERSFRKVGEPRTLWTEDMLTEEQIPREEAHRIVSSLALATSGSIAPEVYGEVFEGTMLEWMIMNDRISPPRDALPGPYLTNQQLKVVVVQVTPWARRQGVRDLLDLYDQGEWTMGSVLPFESLLLPGNEFLKLERAFVEMGLEGVPGLPLLGQVERESKKPRSRTEEVRINVQVGGRLRMVNATQNANSPEFGRWRIVVGDSGEDVTHSAESLNLDEIEDWIDAYGSERYHPR